VKDRSQQRWFSSVGRTCSATRKFGKGEVVEYRGKR